MCWSIGIRQLQRENYRCARFRHYIPLQKPWSVCQSPCLFRCQWMSTPSLASPRNHKSSHYTYRQRRRRSQANILRRSRPSTSHSDIVPLYLPHPSVYQSTPTTTTTTTDASPLDSKHNASAPPTRTPHSQDHSSQSSSTPTSYSSDPAVQSPVGLGRSYTPDPVPSSTSYPGTRTPEQQDCQSPLSERQQ